MGPNQKPTGNPPSEFANQPPSSEELTEYELSVFKRHHPEIEWSEKELNIQTLAALVKLMLPLAERIVSDNYTPDERRRMRALAGSDVFFHCVELVENTMWRNGKTINLGQRNGIFKES